MNKQTELGLAILSGLVLGGLGGGAVFLFAKKQMEDEFQERLAKEVEATKEFYGKLTKAEGFETPEKAAETLRGERRPEVAIKAIQRYQGKREEVEDLEGVDLQGLSERMVQNIFDMPAPEGDLGEEVRDPNSPYVISDDDFNENPLENAQITLTYYLGDKVLADDKEDPIPDDFVNRTVGANNLTRFGEKSGDPKVVYVRNEAIRTDFEVVLSEGKYSEEVQGFRGD